jgi:amino acid adenylation domain-containing protein
VNVPRTLWELLEVPARAEGSAAAAESGDRSVSYLDLYHQARGCALRLHRRGVAHGDRVAILHRNSLTSLAWLFGVARLGAVGVVVSDKLKATQVRHILRHSGARAVVTGRRFRDLLRAAGPDPTSIDIDEVGDLDGDAPLPDAPIGRHLALLIYTSGSTGPPKGVMVTHDNLAAGARIVARYLELTPSDRVLSALPWSFDAGLSQVLSTFYAGGTVVVPRSSFAPDVCRSLVEQRITGLAGVPPLWASLVGPPSPFATLDLPSLRYVTNTGGPMPRHVLRAIREAHAKTAVYLMYGLTEAFRSTYLPPDLVDSHPTSIGRAIPETEILVLDGAGRECAVGEVGELVHRGPTVTAGYWHDPEATAKTYRRLPHGPEGAWPEYVVHSGDFVRRDADGLLHYVGRRDEQFKSRGHRIGPTQIETELLASGLIREIVVFPDQAGDVEPVITAVVVPGVPETFTSEALLDHCRTSLPNHMWPGRIVRVDAIPRTSSGKLDRTLTRARYATGGRPDAAG